MPIVIRMTTGAGRQLGAQHSHSLEGWFAHIPGLRILTPATLADARGMLWPALQDPDPVLIFEHGSLYNVTGELDDDAGPVDIDTAAVRRPGADITLITYGGTLPAVLDAAEQLAAEGIDAEVLDLRTLRPLDEPRSSPPSAGPTEPWWWTKGGAAGASPPKSAPGSPRTRSMTWTPRWAGSAAPRCRSPTRSIWRLAALPSVDRIVAAARQAVSAGG